ncbi:MAG TPA: septum formation family protein [Microbacterium sp.]|nr:septum formation family protein [Microbacterium sp.]
MILRTRTARALFVGGALAAAASLAGCGQISSLLGGAERDSETNQVTEAGTDSVFDIQVGDCMAEPEGDQVYDVDVVPCTEEHDYEFYYAYDLDLGDEFPTDETLSADADQKCYDAFTDFVGIPFEESAALYYSYYSPSPESWADGDREIQCLVYEGDDTGTAVPITGSLKGSKR